MAVSERHAYHPFLIIRGTREGYGAYWGLYALAHLALEGHAIDVARGEVADNERIGRREFYCHREPNRGLALEIDIDGLTAIEGDGLHAVALGVVFVETQAAHHLGHQFGRLESGELVANVGACAEDTKVGKLTGDGRHSPTLVAVVLDEKLGIAGIYIGGAG